MIRGTVFNPAIRTDVIDACEPLPLRTWFLGIRSWHTGTFAYA